MIHEHISEVSMKTYHALSTYLVGGFDFEKNYRPCLQILTGSARQVLMPICMMADKLTLTYRPCEKSLGDIEKLVKILLSQAEAMEFNGYKYTFNVTDFNCSKAMSYLVQDVLAQVNEE